MNLVSDTHSPSITRTNVQDTCLKVGMPSLIAETSLFAEYKTIAADDFNIGSKKYAKDQHMCCIKIAYIAEFKTAFSYALQN